MICPDHEGVKGESTRSLGEEAALPCNILALCMSCCFTLYLRASQWGSETYYCYQLKERSISPSS